MMVTEIAGRGKGIRRSKGVSPVIASIFVVLIAIASAIVFYSYVMGFVESGTKTTDAHEGVLSLDFAYVNSTNVGSSKGFIIAYIRNVGGVDLKLTNAYISSPNGEFEAVNLTGVNFEDGSEIITPLHAKKLILNVTSVDIVVGYVYSVRVVCSDGTSIVFAVRASC